MKAAKRSILICVLTLILSVSLLAGVTFAWFTDSITNSGNTIQSGELAIDATAYDRVDAAETDGLTVTIGEGNVASGTYYFEADGTSLRNGDPVITEDNWQPGDMNAKLFTVSNEGSIDAVVSLDFFVSGDLAQYLWYDFIAVNPADGSLLGEFLQRYNLNTISDLADSYGEVTLKPEEQVTFLFVYGLPTSATNEAMNKAVNVNVVVSAKQNVEGAEGPVVVNPGTDLSTTTIDSGDTILLSEGDYEVTQPVAIENKDNVVIDGNGATITRSAASGASIMSASSKRIATAADTQTDLANNIINVSGATNVTIRNLTIVGALHHGINIWECENVVLENVTITNSAAAGITINASDVTVTNIHTSGNAWGGINVDIGDNSADGTTIYTKLTVSDINSTFDEYFPIYADSAEIADNIETELKNTWNVKWAEHNVYDHNGNARVVWTTDKNVADGDMFVNSSKSFSTAIKNNHNVYLLTDIQSNDASMLKSDYVPGYDRNNKEGVATYYGLNYSGTINLNGYSLNLYSVLTNAPIVIGQTKTLNSVTGESEYSEEPNNVTIKNGTLIAAGLLVLDGATLTIEDVEYNSKLTSLGVQGKNSTVNVTGSTVTSKDAFVIGTNASAEGEDGTGTHGVIINVTGSTLKSDYIDADSGSVTVFFNVPGNLNIEDSTIYGVQNAVAVRGGTANISNSTLSTPNGVSLDGTDISVGWGSGNALPFGTLLVGNNSESAYQYPSNVTVTNTTITSNNAEVPAIYIWGNATEEIGATVTLDEYTNTNLEGDIAGDPTGKYSCAKVITTVTTHTGLSTAARGGGYVVLANDLNNVSLNIPISGVDTVVDLNGKTIYMTGYHAIPFYAFRITDGTLKVFNGTIDATRASNRVDGIVAYGNSSLTLSNLTIKSVDGCVMSENANNEVTIDNCDIESGTYYAVYQNGSESPCEITIKGSTIVGGVYISNASTAGREKQTLTIENCTILGGDSASAVGTALEIKHTNATITNTTLIGVGEIGTREEGSGGCSNGYALAVTSNRSDDYTTGEVVLTDCTLLYKATAESETSEGSVFVFTIAEGDGNSVMINGTPATETDSYGA